MEGAGCADTHVRPGVMRGAMIVTSKKDPQQVKAYAGNAKRLVIIGCSECAAVCRTGGSEQVKEMAELFADREVLATISIESPCDKRITARDLKRIDEEIAGADAVIALTCGSGVQAIAEVTGREIIAALDTHFLGMVERLGKFYERCSHCGSCILNDTAGICPVTRCPKSMRNGPCEGIQDTKCEVFTDRECVWHTIYEKLKERGQLERFTVYHEPVDWSKCMSPREELWERS
ncbi:MAG: 5,10-methylenetetrahydrofolate reductase [Spirochaetes bacterium]|nr:MAG: 5,10-methylenetetrahydrofolate reductase [Spirochaetota bacterium]